jgi:quercetin dioxygenase-like cupin family protein
MKALKRSKLTLIFAVGASFIAGITLGAALAREPAKRFALLLSTSKTVVDEPIAYPAGTAKITTGVVTLDPGDETGWHTHGVPLTGLMLEGALTVDYGDKGKRTFHQGQSIAEAINVPHNGRNLGTAPVKLFVAYAGAEGMPTITPLKKDQ